MFSQMSSESSLAIVNIRSLVQVRESTTTWVSGNKMDYLPSISNAFLIIEQEKIAAFGPMEKFRELHVHGQVIDATDRFVLPAFADSHTHLVFANSREAEFVDRIKGKSYAEIATAGGGILNSAKNLREMSEDELFIKSCLRAEELLALGTAAVEIKSGYGLTTKDELKMLRVARRVGRETPLKVKTTFLGAHAVPQGISKKDYIAVIKEEMIPAIVEENLADYIDVFCEKRFFTREETEDIVNVGKSFGLVPKIHGNQLHRSGGVQAAVATGARSVDHLERIGREEIELLLNSSTMPTLLPGAAFFLDDCYPPARQMIDAGLPVALATDFNPGSSPTGNMSFILSLACIRMKMTPEEAINAATINGAYAMDVLDTHGSITIGKAGSVVITKPISSLAYLPYSFGSLLIEQVVANGELLYSPLRL